MDAVLDAELSVRSVKRHAPTLTVQKTAIVRNPYLTHATHTRCILIVYLRVIAADQFV